MALYSQNRVDQSAQSDTWLEQTGAHLEGRTSSWAEYTLEVIRIFVDNIIANVIVEDKNIFIQLLTHELLGESCDIIINKKTSAELLSLV